MSEQWPPSHPLHEDNRKQWVPEVEATEKNEQQEYIIGLVEDLIRTNGWEACRPQLKELVDGIDRGIVQAKMPDQYGLTVDAAAHFDRDNRKIVIFDHFFKMSKNLQVHILHHEFSHALEVIFDVDKYNEITKNHDHAWDGEYVHQLKDKVKDKRLYEQEQRVDDLADFLRSQSPVQMFILRLRRIPLARLVKILPAEWRKISWKSTPLEDLQAELEEDIKKPDSILRQSKLYQEIELLYEFFDQTVRRGLTQMTSEDVDVKDKLENMKEQLREDPFDGFDELDLGLGGIGDLDDESMPSGQKEPSFFQLLTHNIALAQQQDVRSLFKK